MPSSPVGIRNKPRTIANEIRTAIFVGQLKPGDKLPSVREADEDWKQTKDSVARAYKLLSKEGVLVDSDDRGPLPGYMVNPDTKPPGEKERVARLDSLIANAVASGRKLGYSIPELESAVERVMAKVKRTRSTPKGNAEQDTSMATH